MLTQNYHYNQVVKKCVAVFGTMFNNVTIGRVAENGVVSNVSRCPIAYGPRQKFLDRITQQADLTEDKVAIKVPRMSFEITSIQYDAEAKLNRLNRVTSQIEGDPNRRNTQWKAVPYLLGMQLNIYGRNQDDVLQILEQILPEFQPEYTVTVKDLEAPGINGHIPIALNSVTLTDDYDGTYDRRRVIVYTLDFTMRIRFSAPPSIQGVIRFTESRFTPSMDTSLRPSEYVHVGIGSPNDTPENYTIVTTIDDFGFDEGFIPQGVLRADSTEVRVDADREIDRF